MNRFLLSFGILLLSTTVWGADISTSKMLLRGVDKITGRVKTMQATVGKPLTFGALTILPDRCLTKPQEEMPENAVFLHIFETIKDNTKKQVFQGWMFSSNPALSAMEHPIYDVWLLSCLNNDITADVVSPEPVLREEDLNLVADEDNPALATDDEIQIQPLVVPTP